MSWLLRLRRLGVLAALAMTVTSALIAVPQNAAATSPSDHVLYWNDVLLRTYRQVGGPPAPLARAGAMMHGAVYDAANSALCAVGQGTCLGQPYLIKVTPTAGVIPDLATAIDYAAYNTLKAVYPSLNFDTDLATAQSDIPASSSRTEGVSVGTATAQAMINARSNDGSTNNTPYEFSTAPGFWRPTGSGPAATPNWGLVKPFAMTSGSQFRPGPPAGYATMSALLASPEYAAQVNEVKQLGRAANSTRTADQTQTAWFWANDLDGTYKPPGQLFAHTQIVSKLKRLTQAGNARLFGLVAIAMADAAIVAWDAKYLTNIDLWRPETAIQLADTDGNPATDPDTAWLPLSADRNGVNFSPPFPAYTSGHATFAAAWAGAMRNFFSTDTVTFTATTDDPHAVGVTRRFSSFSAAMQEDARSRVYLGVHYQFDADGGISSGTALANYVFANYLRPVTTYTFNGFYVGGNYVGNYIEVPLPRTVKFEFQLTDASGNVVRDLGAIIGASALSSATVIYEPTFNSTTGRYEISIYTQKVCPGTFTVQLRDGTSHSIVVDCIV